MLQTRSVPNGEVGVHVIRGPVGWWGGFDHALVDRHRAQAFCLVCEMHFFSSANPALSLLSFSQVTNHKGH